MGVNIYFCCICGEKISFELLTWGVMVPNMLGAEFDYSVARIDRSKTAESEKLINEEYCLTIFARDSKTSDYIIVRCAKAV